MKHKGALVIGGGPAGLMAADVISAAGHPVIVAEAKPTVARKFLMAGKSGLNLTKDEPLDGFMGHFGDAAKALAPMIEAFGPQQVTQWAQSLGQETFVGSSGRVFPKVMKASPLLRNWLVRLQGQGVGIRTRHRWVGLQDGFRFETSQGEVTLQPDAVILACGGASWARLGSDAAWAGIMDMDLASFAPANMGFQVEWSAHMARHFGQPVKSVALKVADKIVRGEFVISKQGLEGGGIYAVSKALREGAPLYLDLVPDLSEAELRKRLSRPRGKASLSNHLRKCLKLDPVKQALLMEFARPLPSDLAPVLKHLPIALLGPAPMDQAISTAGGIRFAALDEGLMLRDRPGIFAAGEMLDWEAPTGGYLLTGCLATGRYAGVSALNWLG